MASSSSPPPPCTVAAGGGIAGVSPVRARRQVLAQVGWWPGRMALSYGARQTCYIVRGKVTATATATASASAAEGSPENGRRVEFGAGDIVVFPKGTRCTWHIAAAVDMHYAFDPS